MYDNEKLNSPERTSKRTPLGAADMERNIKKEIERLFRNIKTPSNYIRYFNMIQEVKNIDPGLSANITNAWSNLLSRYEHSDDSSGFPHHKPVSEEDFRLMLKLTLRESLFENGYVDGKNMEVYALDDEFPSDKDYALFFVYKSIDTHKQRLGVVEFDAPQRELERGEKAQKGNDREAELNL